MKDVYIGVDIGGMSIKAGAVEKNGLIIFKRDIVTSSRSESKFIEGIKEILNKVINESKEKGLNVLGIGFGIPGLIDNEKGIINKMANIDGTSIDLKEHLKEFKLPIKISNDANVACLAEQKYGAAKGYRDCILITLGTGVGGGVVINNKLYEGNLGKGSELGHMVIQLNGEKCGCGRRGCLESYASASALIRETIEAMNKNPKSMMRDYCNHDINNVNGLTSFECAKKGDKTANEVIDTYVMYLGEGLLNYCNIFRPQTIVIGGGLSNQGDYLRNKIEDYLKKNKYGFEMSPEVIIKIAKLKNDAGIIGAASLFID